MKSSDSDENMDSDDEVCFAAIKTGDKQIVNLIFLQYFLSSFVKRMQGAI